jgi:hypothetical protein
MNILNFLLVTFGFCSSGLALVDSHKDFPTKVANWTITSHHMDTGDLRSCSAKGKFEDLEIAIGNPFGSKLKDISFRFVKGGTTPGPANPGEQRACGTSKNHAPSGSYRYNPNNSSEEFCDGKAWIKPTEGHFKNVLLVIGGNEVAAGRETAAFKVGTISGKPVFFEYSAWFQQVQGLEKKLSRPGNIELRVEGLAIGPIVLGDRHLDQVLAELTRCERERK